MVAKLEKIKGALTVRNKAQSLLTLWFRDR